MVAGAATLRIEFLRMLGLSLIERCAELEKATRYRTGSVSDRVKHATSVITTVINYLCLGGFKAPNCSTHLVGWLDPVATTPGSVPTSDR
ncbi:MAG: hypothetical protein QOH71_2704 [Blastocatellia bacterium]|nr:hypothetical protein [Blastocatellia bacterium]